MKYKVEVHVVDGESHYILIGPARWTSLFAIDVPDELIKEYHAIQGKLHKELEQNPQLGKQ